MSNTFKDTKAYKRKWVSIHGWTSTWGKRIKKARFLKHRLSKSRRRWEDERERGLASANSDVNYRGW